MFNKTVAGYIFYHSSKILQTNKKTRKINLFNAIAKTFKDVKFTVDGIAFQTFVTRSTKNFRLVLAVNCYYYFLPQVVEIPGVKN